MRCICFHSPDILNSYHPGKIQFRTVLAATHLAAMELERMGDDLERY